MSSARLLPTLVPDRPDGVVLVLHGGAARTGGRMVSPTQLSVLRMVPIARRIARQGAGRLAVYRLLNTTRGWDTRHTPVDDVVWALAKLADRHGARPPTGLVGHSLGGRAALLAAPQPGVLSAVALNPWLYPSDEADVGGRRVLVVHGTEDRVAPLDRSVTVASALARTAESVGLLTVEGGKHAMLRRGRVFEEAAADFVAATMLGDEVPEPVNRLLHGREQVSV